MHPDGTTSTVDSRARAGGNGSSKIGGYAWSHVHGRINQVVDNFFYRLGYWVATHSKRTVAISLLLVVACCFGFANFRIEADGEDLWVPANSLSKRHQSIVADSFADDEEYASLLMESPSGTGNVLNKESFDALWDLHDIVLAIESGGKTYADLCAKELDGVTCVLPFRGVTRFWGNERANYEASVTNDADVLEAVNVEAFPDGQPVNQQALFGNSIEYDSDGNIVAASAMFQAYGLGSDPDQDAQINDDVFDWNEEFQDTMERRATNFEAVLKVFYLTSRSIDDALEESVSGEIILFVTTYIIMIVFVMAALGRCFAGPVKRRTWLGLGGVGFVVAAGLAAYGINSGFGVPFTSLSQILPFILIGIGVDDMFVIVAAFDHTDSKLPVEERVALGLKRCGVSITYTSLTNFFAFLLGSQTLLPAVEYFCQYACTAILFDYLLQMTAFVALLTMDANRQKAGRMDWLCCFTSKKYLEDQEDIQRGVSVPKSEEAEAVEHSASGSGGGNPPASHYDLSDEVHQLSPVGRFMRDKCAPVLLSWKGKALVVLATAGLLAAGIYGVSKATQGFDVLDLAPDDHFSRDYTEEARRYELDISEWYVPLNVVTRDVDYKDVSVQAQIQATDELMLEQQFVEGPLSSWLVSFVSWAGTSTGYSAYVGTSGGYPVYDDPATFYAALSEFLQDPDNDRFTADVIFNGDGTIQISRSAMYLIDLTDTTNNVDALEDARDVVGQSALDPKPFGYAGVFVFTEQYLVIYEELLISFALALVAVFALSVFVLGKLTVVALVCVTVFMIDVGLLGFLYHWGLEVNAITVIQLIMAVGLVVDYMVHIVHYFLHQDPNISKDLRIANALGEIGPSVVVGATTTFLGILPLAFANNVIFRVFFRMFLIIISFGFFHGMVFIPVMLSLLPDRLVSQLPYPKGSSTVVANSVGSSSKGANAAAQGSNGP